MSGVKSPQEPLQVGLRVMPSGKHKSGAQAKKVNRFPYLITYGASNFADTFLFCARAAATPTEKPPQEIAPTTMRLALLIYSFQFRCAFLFRHLAGRPASSRHCDVPGFQISLSLLAEQNKHRERGPIAALSVIGNRNRQKPVPKIRDTLTDVRHKLQLAGRSGPSVISFSDKR